MTGLKAARQLKLICHPELKRSGEGPGASKRRNTVPGKMGKQMFANKCLPCHVGKSDVKIISGNSSLPGMSPLSKFF